MAELNESWEEKLRVANEKEVEEERKKKEDEEARASGRP